MNDLTLLPVKFQLRLIQVMFLECGSNVCMVAAVQSIIYVIPYEEICRRNFFQIIISPT